MTAKTNKETSGSKEAKIPNFEVKEEIQTKPKTVKKTTEKKTDDIDVNRIIKYRTRRKNRRCRFCKYLTHQSCPAPICDGWDICTAKDKEVKLWVPRIFCSCYDLKDVNNGKK